MDVQCAIMEGMKRDSKIEVACFIAYDMLSASCIFMDFYFCCTSYMFPIAKINESF